MNKRQLKKLAKWKCPACRCDGGGVIRHFVDKKGKWRQKFAMCYECDWKEEQDDQVID